MHCKSLTRGTRAFVLLCLTAALPVPGSARQSTAVSDNTPGALIRMDMHTVVGVELDEIPAGPVREAASLRRDPAASSILRATAAKLAPSAIVVSRLQARFMPVLQDRKSS